VIGAEESEVSSSPLAGIHEAAMVKLDGKVAVITAANSGMGLASAGDDHRDECIADVES
jgi:hypothetical protein